MKEMDNIMSLGNVEHRVQDEFIRSCNHRSTAENCDYCTEQKNHHLTLPTANKQFFAFPHHSPQAVIDLSVLCILQFWGLLTMMGGKN